MSAEPTTLLDGRAFLEGPRWHDGALWVSDMHAQQVLRVQPDGTVDVVAEVAGDPSGLGFWSDGSVLIVSMRDRRLLRMVDSEAPALLADCSDLARHRRRGGPRARRSLRVGVLGRRQRADRVDA